MNCIGDHYCIVLFVTSAILHVDWEQHPRAGCSLSVVRGETVQWVYGHVRFFKFCVRAQQVLIVNMLCIHNLHSSFFCHLLFKLPLVKQCTSCCWFRPSALTVCWPCHTYLLQRYWERPSWTSSSSLSTWLISWIARYWQALFQRFSLQQSCHR